jgi:hypothetical protein
MEGRDLDPTQGSGKTLGRRLAIGLGALALVLSMSQLRCAKPEDFLNDDDMGTVNGDGGTSDSDGGQEGPCFTGTPADEVQLLTKCTSALHEERPHRVPAATWDPKTPLPYGPP